MVYEQDFKVLNMNCNHCVKTIDKALRVIKGIEDVIFNLADKNVKVVGDVSAKLIIHTLTEAGYEVKG